MDEKFGKDSLKVDASEELDDASGENTTNLETDYPDYTNGEYTNMENTGTSKSWLDNRTDNQDTEDVYTDNANQALLHKHSTGPN